MRTRFSTRAALVGLVPVAALTLRAAPTGGGLGAARADGLPAARAALAVDESDVSYPSGTEDEVSRSQVDVADLQWPAPGPITSPFGGARHHPGLDIDGVTGDPVKAAGPGTVLLAGMAPAGYEGYGNVVMIDHGRGISTLYAHLSRVDVTMGQQVEQGQVVGAIGATGLAFGDHLHFEVRVANHPVDPIPWLPPRP